MLAGNPLAISLLARVASARADCHTQSGRAERIRAERVLLTEGQRPIAGEFKIEQIVDEGVGADAADMRSNARVQVPTLRNVDKRPDPSFVKAYTHNGSRA
jgi:hypothetical protein